MRFARVVAACAAIVVLGTVVLVSAGSSATRRQQAAAAQPAATVITGSKHAPATSDGLGIAHGKIKHVWLIILENKSYDASFTGLNRNTYLWQTLPHQGVLLKNYYGTGHFSQDNYLSLVSGQATQSDTQSDCPDYTHFAGHVDLTGSLHSNKNYGQMTSAAGPNAAPGANGCVYPAAVPTLFNQLDKAHVTWKGYAQDLGNPDPGSAPHSAGVNACGAPFAQPAPTGSTTQPNPGSADATDQYVPKHFPFPWFESILRSGDCNSKHIANVFSTHGGLYHDLKRESTTPAFSWITPDNCNDAHDAVCHGNNLSGGFANPTTPRTPVNFTGGLYAADLFLAHVIPEIEASRAFKDGGLIDITFDEAFPPFTYTGNSFANSQRVAPNAHTSILDDSAAETLFGKQVHFEPTGPNTPLATDSQGNQLYPGPGYNSFVDRPSNCVAQTTPKQPAGTCLLGGGDSVPGPRTDAGATALAGSSTIDDNAATAIDPGRTVTGSGIPAGAHVGQVTDTPVPATKANQDGGFVDKGSFQLVDASGHPITTTGPVSGITLGAESPQTDPLFDAKDPTTGGGDTGSVLISPYIRPGSVSKRFYNHYSWLRTMEDLFAVSARSPGLDRNGHIGYAAQPGLAPFGRDVFNRPNGPSHHAAKASLPSWLPSATVAPADPVVTATPSRSRLAIEGDTVAVRLPGGRAKVTAVGPAVPEQGQSPVPATSPCQFTVTLAAVHGSIPLSARDFSFLGEHGQRNGARVTLRGGGRLPRRIVAGRPVTLTLSAVLPTGNGQLRWAPLGSRPLVSWDFEVEID
ncbi:MAG TPA: alkaline phosphatase family protein [Solirubrobacteraceae bacterium]